MVSFKKFLTAAALVCGVVASAQAADITGAGATFPYPIYAKWAEDYKKVSKVGLNYQSIGSSGGIRQIRAKTVTFGGTDAPLSGADLEKDSMVQFPTVLGGVVPIVNLEDLNPVSCVLPVRCSLKFTWGRSQNGMTPKSWLSIQARNCPISHYGGSPGRWFRHNLYFHGLFKRSQ